MLRLCADPTFAVGRRLFQQLRGDENDYAVGNTVREHISHDTELTHDTEFNRRALVRQLNFLHFCDLAAQVCVI